MADAKPAEIKGDAAAVAPAGGGKMKVIVMALIATVVIGAGVGGGLYFFGGHDDEEEVTAEEEETSAEEDEKPGSKTGKGKGKKGGKEPAAKQKAVYVKLEPFVVNFEAQGVVRYLQITAEIMTRDPALEEAIKLHDPAIRNDLLLLFGNQQYETLSSREGKEKLREDALAVVRQVISAEGVNGSKIESILFTSFVMQ